jgi:uncharacterized protein (TIGR02145 family)
MNKYKYYLEMKKIVFQITLIFYFVLTSTLVGQTNYKKVNIGGDNWMRENLNVSRFRNGDIIPEAKTDKEWATAFENGQPAWCYFENDSINGQMHGKLYNWYAVKDPRGLAPLGWHIPSDEDWNRLIDSLGGYSNAVTLYFNKNKTLNTEFNAVPNGSRGKKKFFKDGDFIFWWLIDVGNNRLGCVKAIDFKKQKTMFALAHKSFGIPVRCIEDFKDYNVESWDLSKLKVVNQKDYIDSMNGSSYHVNTIGNQVWLCDNLNRSRFNNGDTIHEAKSSKEWGEAIRLKQPAWCYYDNDSLNGVLTGKLYNWYAVVDPRGLAPTGWHIPSSDEWDELSEYLSDYPGGVLLKSETGWDSYKRAIYCKNCLYLTDQQKTTCQYCGGDGKLGSKVFYGNGINFLGFNVVPSGKRVKLQFPFIGLYGIVRQDGTSAEQVTYFWSSTSAEKENSIAVKISNQSKYLGHVSVNRYDGFSVRCIKD